MMVAAPAMADDSIATGDINTQFAQNSVGDISVTATQTNSGDATATDGGVAVISQNQGVSVSVTQAPFQFLNTGFFFIH